MTNTEHPCSRLCPFIAASQCATPPCPHHWQPEEQSLFPATMIVQDNSTL